MGAVRGGAAGAVESRGVDAGSGTVLPCIIRRPALPHHSHRTSTCSHLPALPSSLLPGLSRCSSPSSSRWSPTSKLFEAFTSMRVIVATPAAGVCGAAAFAPRGVRASSAHRAPRPTHVVCAVGQSRAGADRVVVGDRRLGVVVARRVSCRAEGRTELVRHVVVAARHARVGTLDACETYALSRRFLVDWAVVCRNRPRRCPWRSCPH